MSTNQMNPRHIAVPSGAETVIIGVGMEGKLNGGRRFSLCVDLTGIALAKPMVVQVYRIARPGAAPAPDPGALAAIGSQANIFPFDVEGDAIRVTGLQDSGAPISPIVSCEVDV